VIVAFDSAIRLKRRIVTLRAMNPVGGARLTAQLKAKKVLLIGDDK
jgi:hypothetical protein